MKNLLFGILAVAAFFCLFPLGFTSCDEHIEPDVGNNGSETGTAITSLSELYSALDGLPANTVSTPHTIVVNLNSFIVIANALKSYPDKYVYLDISGSTFTSIGNNAFSGCTSLISVSIGNSVSSIGDEVFSGCINLTGVIIGNGVTSIGDEVFSGCTTLTSVTIGNGVTGIGTRTFIRCESLTSISVTIDNPVYSSGNGLLYNKNKTALLAYPRGKTDNALTIPDSVTSIGDYAFWYCTSLRTVNFNGTIPSVGFSSSAFPGNLAVVYYSTNPSIGTPVYFTTTNPGVYPNWVRQT